MGTFTHPILVSNMQTGQSQELDALVDTGATFTTIPASILRDLGIEEADHVEMRLADGRIIQAPLGYAVVKVDGKSTIGPCLFGQPGWPTLLGAVTMESLLLAPDPVDKRLIPLRGWLAENREEGS